MRSQDRSSRLSFGSFRIVVTAFAVAFMATLAAAQIVPQLSGPSQAMETVPARPMPKWNVDDIRKMRAYPDQPPVIPHSIEGYQLSVNTNRCLSCHKREFTEGAGAPMISVTHYMTREGQMLADVSPRRYFCTACHVPQAEVNPLVGNTFRDMSQMGVEHLGGK
ncbi:cytochrome c-type protein NapB [Rhizobium petrolearium]|uniref:nitrate reductase cytochrome c-type subunit n=1 Tax=Neorhizobium petrolearium TaxID=515361 RepID=UPI001AE1640A|nr:cytochrome c-type protein NapB [Neorhizobium petrolearium]